MLAAGCSRSLQLFRVKKKSARVLQYFNLQSKYLSSVRKMSSIEKSAIDKRSYRHVTLSNKMGCLLVSDPETEKSSACCDVFVGSMSDPKEVPGLAHFLEHMLFLGTEKYPVENAYSQFLSSHGGYSNAYTAQENTVYYFDVLNGHFEEALSMFASFFTCPLFTETATSRELNAVDSENTKNLQNDSWRKFQLFKSLARPDHPLNSFSTGNMETLSKTPESNGINTRDVVIEFYNKYYSANLMKLVVYGKEDLDTLEQWVASSFSAVPNKDLTRPVFESDPLGPHQLAKSLEAVPIKDVKTMELLFPLPAVEHLYRVKPARYFSHLIGHESEGSILATLKGKQWANGLSSYMYQSLHDFSVFAVSVELTEEGVNHTEDIAECVFAYIGMLQRSGPQDWVWDEMKETADMNFRFVNKSEPSDYCTKLANNMQVFNVEHTITGDELYFEKNLDLSMQYLAQLKPNRSILSTFHRGFTGKTALKERWYGTDYNLSDLSAELLGRWENAMTGGSQWDSVLSLPKPNPFIPTDFGLKNEAGEDSAGKRLPSVVHCVATGADEPAELLAAVSLEEAVVEVPVTPAVAAADEGEESDDESTASAADVAAPLVSLPPLPGKQITTWYQPDTTWKVPKMHVTVSLECQYATSSPLCVTLAELTANCLKEILVEYSYYADCAGLHYDVGLSKGGLTLSFNGYHHKLPVLVGKALEELHKLGSGKLDAVDSQLFDRMREKSLRTYKNFVFWQPYYHCITNTLSSLEDPRWTHAEKHAALSGASKTDFISFVDTYLRSLKASVLVYGNATEEEARAVSTTIVNTLQFESLPNSQEFVRRSVSLKPGVEYLLRGHSKAHNPNEVNSGIENVYTVGPVGGNGAAFDEAVHSVNDYDKHPLVAEAMLELVTHIIAEPAFDQLRTKEQLGYIVHAGTKKVGQSMCMHVIIQSGVKDPHYLNTRIEDFLEAFRGDLAQYSEEKFTSYVNAVVEKLIEKPKNIDEESHRYWEEINNGTYLFDRKKQLVSVLQAKGTPLTLQTVLQFYDRYFLDKVLRKKFSSQFYGANCKYQPVPQGVVQIKDVAAFKRSMPLYPVLNFEEK